MQKNMVKCIFFQDVLKTELVLNVLNIYSTDKPCLILEISNSSRKNLTSNCPEGTIKRVHFY